MNNIINYKAPEENLKDKSISHPFGDVNDDHIIELAPMEASSVKSRRKKKKKKISKTGDDDTDELSVSSAPSLRKKKKKKSNKTKEGGKSKKAKQDSQSSCSVSDFYSSMSSLDTFEFDAASHDSDQDSCYKSTGALTPVAQPKKLVAPSSAPLGNERKKRLLAPNLASPNLESLTFSTKQSDFLTRRGRRRAHLGAGEAILTPTSIKKLTLETDQSLNNSLPDLFASSPGGMDNESTASGGRRRLMLTPTSRRKMTMKVDGGLHRTNSLPNLFDDSSQGTGGIDDSSIPSRGRRRRLKSSDVGVLTQRSHTRTPTSRDKLTLEIEKSLHESLPTLFAPSPGRGGLDEESIASGGRRRLMLTPTSRRKMNLKIDGGFQRSNSLPNLFDEPPPGTVGIDDSSIPARGRRRRLKSSDVGVLTQRSRTRTPTSQRSHTRTPTSRDKLTVEIEKSLHESLPNLFAPSPGRGGLDDESIASAGRRRRMLTPTSRRKFAMKVDSSLHNSMPDLFATSPGRGGSDDQSIGSRGRRSRPNSLDRRARSRSRTPTSSPGGLIALDDGSDRKTWTPRAPTLTKRISSRSLMDEIGNSSMNSFVSANDDSSDDPFNNSASSNKPAKLPLTIPDLFADSDDEDDLGLSYEDGIASSSARMTDKTDDAVDPFGIVTPFEQSSIRIPSKAFIEHEDGDTGSHGNLSIASPNTVEECGDGSSESSFDGDEFLSPTNHGPLKQIIDQYSDDERSLDVEDLFAPSPVSSPVSSQAKKSKEDTKGGESQGKSDIPFGFVSPFRETSGTEPSTAEKSKKASRKASDPRNILEDEFSQSFHDALSVASFESEKFESGPDSPKGSKKTSFSGKVLCASSLHEEMSHSFHDALSVNPFESEETGEFQSEVFDSQRNKFRGKVISTTDTLMSEEMTRSFHDALSVDPFDESEKLNLREDGFKTEDFDDSEQSYFSGKVISTAVDMNAEMNRSFHDALSVDLYESEEIEIKGIEDSTRRDVIVDLNEFSGKVITTSGTLMSEEMSHSFHDAFSIDPLDELEERILEDTEEIEDEQFDSERKDFNGKAVATTDSLIDEMNRSFHGAFGVDLFQPEDMELKDTKENKVQRFSAEEIGTTDPLIDELNRSFHDTFGVDLFEKEDTTLKDTEEDKGKVIDTTDPLIDELNRSFHDAFGVDLFEKEGTTLKDTEEYEGKEIDTTDPLIDELNRSFHDAFGVDLFEKEDTTLKDTEEDKGKVIDTTDPLIDEMNRSFHDAFGVDLFEKEDTILKDTEEDKGKVIDTTDPLIDELNRSFHDAFGVDLFEKEDTTLKNTEEDKGKVTDTTDPLIDLNRSFHDAFGVDLLEKEDTTLKDMKEVKGERFNSEHLSGIGNVIASTATKNKHVDRTLSEHFKSEEKKLSDIGNMKASTDSKKEHMDHRLSAGLVEQEEALNDSEYQSERNAFGDKIESESGHSFHEAMSFDPLVSEGRIPKDSESIAAVGDTKKAGVVKDIHDILNLQNMRGDDDGSSSDSDFGGDDLISESPSTTLSGSVDRNRNRSSSKHSNAEESSKSSHGSNSVDKLKLLGRRSTPSLDKLKSSNRQMKTTEKLKMPTHESKSNMDDLTGLTGRKKKVLSTSRSTTSLDKLKSSTRRRVQSSEKLKAARHESNTDDLTGFTGLKKKTTSSKSWQFLRSAVSVVSGSSRRSEFAESDEPEETSSSNAEWDFHAQNRQSSRVAGLRMDGRVTLSSARRARKSALPLLDHGVVEETSRTSNGSSNTGEMPRAWSKDKQMANRKKKNESDDSSGSLTSGKELDAVGSQRRTNSKLRISRVGRSKQQGDDQEVAKARGSVVSC